MRREIRDGGTPFHFNTENSERLKNLIAHYPEGREQSAVIAALDLGQRQNGGWVSREVVEEVSRVLGLPEIRVYEIASFYTMFNLQPVGKHLVQVCTTTPCWLRGSDEVLAVCHKKAAEYGADTFTIMEVECLGACVNAPVVRIGDDYFEDLDGPGIEQLLERMAQGEPCISGTCSSMAKQDIKPNKPDMTGEQ